ncbi:MAG: hypothetical protein IPG04_13785 [Polyangiaceae bacterium]|nr:hypothetical protein [Polyangiaceae bacterium]
MPSSRSRHLAPLALLLSACAAAPSPAGSGPAKPPASAASPAPTASAPKDTCAPEARKPKASPALEVRVSGVEALAKGKPQVALQAFTKAMDHSPSDVVAFALHAAATADVAEERLRSGRSFGRLKPLAIEPVAPPHKNLSKAAASPPVTLKPAGEEVHNGDWFGWVLGQGLANPLEFGVGGEVPPMFGSTFGEQPVFATYMKPSVSVVRYGPGLLVTGIEGKGLRALQVEPLIAAAFEASTKNAPVDSIWAEVRFVDVVGSTLLATIAHEGDGLKTKSEGFLVGFDLEKDKIAWVTDAGVGNAHATYATGAHVVTAFSEGTTSKVNVIDVATGAVVASESVPDRVFYVIGDGPKVWAWTNTKVYRFTLSSAPAVPEARLGALVWESGEVASGLDDIQRCWLDNAVIALDHRDGPAVLAAVDHLPSDSSARKALEAAGDFLVARAQGASGLDLTERTPIPAEAPAGAVVGKDAGTKVAAPKRLVAIKDPALEPLKPPFLEAPAPLYSTMRLDLFPMRYANTSLEGAFAHGGKTFLNYGRRFVATLEGDELKSLVDLKPLLASSGPAPAATMYFFTLVDGVAYGVVLPPGSPTGFIVALDPQTGKVLWKTATTIFPRPFMVFGGHLLAAQNQGKTGELVMLRLADGQVASTTKTKEPINDLGWDGRGAIYVMLQGKREHFTLK